MGIEVIHRTPDSCFCCLGESEEETMLRDCPQESSKAENPLMHLFPKNLRPPSK